MRSATSSAPRGPRRRSDEGTGHRLAAVARPARPLGRDYPGSTIDNSTKQCEMA